MKRVLAILLLGVTSVAYADLFAPSHSCYEPWKPYEFSSRWEAENFRSEVEEYRQCIADFVEEQKEAIERHQEAAEEAIDEWDRFVTYELN